MKLLFFTAANEKYEYFIPLYIYFAYMSQKEKDIGFEFLVETPGKFNHIVKWAKDTFNCPVVFTKLKPQDIKRPDRARFIYTPQVSAEYTYIGDIDILILESVLEAHAKYMDDEMVYHNVVRPYTKKLSGLQMCSKKYFKITERVRREIYKNYHSDEKLLYDIVERSNLPLLKPKSVEEFVKNRPIHGIHCSINRQPLGRLNWGISESKLRKYSILTNNPTFLTLKPVLMQKAKGLLLNLQLFLDNKVIIVVPYINNRERAFRLKKLLEKRAGHACEVILIDDNVHKEGWINLHNRMAKELDYDWYIYCPDDYFPGRDFLSIALKAARNSGKRMVGFNDGKWHGANATAGMIHKSLIPDMYTDNNLLYPGYKHHGSDPDLSEKAMLMEEFVYAPEALLVEIDYEKDFKKTTNPDDMALFLRRRALKFPKQ